MKLHELEIGDACAGKPREHDAVAGGDGGIGRLSEDLAGAAGRQQHGGCVHFVTPALPEPGADAAAPRTISSCTRALRSTRTLAMSATRSHKQDDG